MDLSITNGKVLSKANDKRDDLNFEIVNFLVLNGDVPYAPSYGVFISELIPSTLDILNVSDFVNKKNNFDC